LKYCEIVVQPLDGKREALGVIAVIIAVCLIVGARLLLLPDSNVSLFMKPYHRLDNTLSELERPMYQALLAAQGEIDFLWEENQTWPTAKLLAKNDIPPFADDLLPASLAGYTWKTYDRGPWVDFIGQREAPGNIDTTILLRSINLHADFHPHPHPGIDYDPNQKIAHQIWFHPQSNQRYPGMQLAERGWFWILSPDDPVLKVKDEK
jgi:hypothetical protein